MRLGGINIGLFSGIGSFDLCDEVSGLLVLKWSDMRLEMMYCTNEVGSGSFSFVIAEGVQLGLNFVEVEGHDVAEIDANF